MSGMDAPPPVLQLARVIAYAAVDSSVRWTGRQKLFVGDELLGAVPRLALCQNISGPVGNVLLFHCNDQWEVLGVSGGPTVEDAKAVAERAYEGITSKWVHMDVSPQEADQWIRTNHSEVICGFCGKLPTDVSGMIRGNGIAICFHCIDKLHTIAHSQ